MAEEPGRALSVDDARAATDVLLEQERVPRHGRFGAEDALRLGGIVASPVPDFWEGASVTITRERDGVRMFQWVAGDKDERNLPFADGKRAAARKAGHASPWARVEAAGAGDAGYVWADVPAEVPACGAFPARVGGEWVATIAASGYTDGLDHEIILRAPAQGLGVVVPRWDAPVA